MNRTAVTNLFRRPGPDQRAGTVKRQVSPGRYQLADDQGRLFYANSDQDWRPGERVVVKAGIIIGRGAVAIPKVFQV